MDIAKWILAPEIPHLIVNFWIFIQRRQEKVEGEEEEARMKRRLFAEKIPRYLYLFRSTFKETKRNRFLFRYPLHNILKNIPRCRFSFPFYFERFFSFLSSAFIDCSSVSWNWFVTRNSRVSDVCPWYSNLLSRIPVRRTINYFLREEKEILLEKRNIYISETSLSWKIILLLSSLMLNKRKRWLAFCR